MKRHPLKSTVTTLMSCILSASLFLLFGCSSIKVVESWNQATPPAQQLKKLMIIGIGHDEALRAMAENILVEELRKGGVEAVASHTLVKEIDSAKREEVVAAIHSVDADGVLTIKPVAKGSTKVTQGGRNEGIYGTATNFGGSPLAGATTYSRATLQTNLYDSKTARLLWSATVSTYDAGDPPRVSRDLADYFLKSFRRDGFL